MDTIIRRKLTVTATVLTMAFAAAVGAAINPITVRLYAPQRESFITALTMLRLH